MSDEKSILDRRSTRLSMAIPVNISGVDAAGQTYSESVRTVIINKHGGKIATTRRLAMGAGVVIENHAVSLMARASVVWLGEERPGGEPRHVGLQLLDAQNIWGIAFPPDDWVADQSEDLRTKPRPLAASLSANAIGTESNLPSSADDENSVRALREMQETTKSCFQDFQNRLRHLTQRLGMELESALRHRASNTKDREVAAIEEHIRVLRDGLDSTRDEVAKLEALVQSLKSNLQIKR